MCGPRHGIFEGKETDGQGDGIDRGGEVESFNGRGATGGAASAEAAEAAGPAGVGEKKAPVGDRRQGGAREAGDAQARAGRLSACR